MLSYLFAERLAARSRLSRVVFEIQVLQLRNLGSSRSSFRWCSCYRPRFVGRGRAVAVLGGVIREALLPEMGESETDGLGVADREDPGVKVVERELVGFGGAEVTLWSCGGWSFVEFIFHGGRGGGVFFPFIVVVCCRAFGVTVFVGVLVIELGCTASFGGEEEEVESEQE